MGSKVNANNKTLEIILQKGKLQLRVPLGPTLNKNYKLSPEQTVPQLRTTGFVLTQLISSMKLKSEDLKQQKVERARRK